MGWEIAFDDRGRIERAACACQDLSGSEFQLAELHDLATLDFSHSLLGDVQLAQYPLQNPSLANLRHLNLNGTKIGDAAIAHLAKFPKLTDLNLSGTNVTEVGLPRLANLPELTTLSLSLTDISDEAIGALSQLHGLQTVKLELTAVSEAGAKQLQAALPGATIVYGASDAVVRQALTYVVRSFRSDGPIRAMAMSSGSSLPKRLHLRGSFGTCSSDSAAVSPASAITDTGLALVSGQTVMEELDLRESAVTDAGLPSLTKLANLKRLDLRGTRVTEQACGRLAKALPGCEILR